MANFTPSVGTPARTVAASSNATGNVGAGEDTLISQTLPGGSLQSNGDHIEVIAWGTFAANANNKNLKMYFGATQIFATGSLGFNGTDWYIRAIIMRTGSGAQDSIVQFVCGDTVKVAAADAVQPSETMSGNITVRCSGEATADNDIVQRGAIIRWIPYSS